MKSSDLFVTYQTGCLIEKMLPLIGETLDYFEGNSVIASYAPILRPSTPWRQQLIERWTIISVCIWLFNKKFRCVLDNEGHVNIYGPGGNPDRTYELPDAGVMREGAGDYGYVNRIRAIGDGLYVCGLRRQIYRFVPGFPDVLDGHWVDFAGAMRQPLFSEPPDHDDGEAFDRWLDDNESIDLVDIAGSSESDIYTAGDECWHYNGVHWQPLQLPTDAAINAIKIISAEQVVMVGRNGTLLMGNARQGFKELSSIDDNQSFTGVEWFNGKLFLASNFGLFVYDPADPKIVPYATSLTPDLQDTHILEAKDGVMWSFGFKDLAYFDGNNWTRVDNPYNPPIR